MSFFRNTAKPQPCNTTGYVPPLSGQFKIICGASPLNLYNRLSSFVGRLNMAPFAPWMFAPRKCPTDSEVYLCCGRRPMNSDAGAARAISMGTAAADAIRPVATPTRILDIGCGDATISAQIGRQLGLAENRVFGIDLMPATPNIAINNYVQYDGAIMPPGVRYAAAFDCILVQQVLHHVDNIPLFMAELDYVLAPGGIVFIKEHHIQTAADMMMVDVEHMLYKIHGGGDEQGDFKVRNYKSASDWDAVFAAYDRVDGDWFFADGANMRISATKTYYMIYRKPVSSSLVVAPLPPITEPLPVNEFLDDQVRVLIGRVSNGGSSGRPRHQHRQ